MLVTYSSRVPAQTQVLVDRALYVPQDWAEDGPRRREAGGPDDVVLATKPDWAQRMLARVRAAGLPAAWVTGDSVYGGSGPLRDWLAAQHQPDVLASAKTDGVDVPYGTTARHVSAQEIAPYALAPHDWQRLAAGDGSQGPRLSDGAFVRLAAPSAAGFEQALLIRRPLDAPPDPKQRAYYLTSAPVGTLFETLIAGAGRRWTIEESLEAAKGEVGLDHYEVRHYHGWYRHMTLALLALASRAVVRARVPGAAGKRGILWLSSVS